jgi:hypothetical protein
MGVSGHELLVLRQGGHRGLFVFPTASHPEVFLPTGVSSPVLSGVIHESLNLHSLQSTSIILDLSP